MDGEGRSHPPLAGALGSRLRSIVTRPFGEMHGSRLRRTAAAGDEAFWRNEQVLDSTSSVAATSRRVSSVKFSRPPSVAVVETPHDALFRKAFGSVEAARGMLESLAPKSVLAKLDLDSLRPAPGTFVDQALAKSQSDLLFSATLAGRPALVYFLLEHKSYPDRWVGLQLAAYIIRIWEKSRQQEPPPQFLPPVIPLVVHHGPNGWAASARHAARRRSVDVRRFLAFVPDTGDAHGRSSSFRCRRRLLGGYCNDASWRSLKHGWLFLNQVDTFSRLEKLIAFCVQQHHQVMPHGAFQGQTPDEVFAGTGDQIPQQLARHRHTARRERIETNRRLNCRSCFFAGPKPDALPPPS